MKLDLVNAYLIFSYLYYEKDESIVSDYFYDNMCRTMLDNFDKLGDSEYKDMVTEDALRAGTGHHLVGKFPEPVVKKAEALIKPGAKLKDWEAWFKTQENKLK